LRQGIQISLWKGKEKRLTFIKARGNSVDMVSVTDVDAQEFIVRIAEKLKNMEQVRPPAWAAFAKTGVHKERPPSQKDWWWIRAASLLRKVALNEKIGVSQLRKVYGGRKNRGHKPEHKYRASGAVIRKALQQLEAAGLIVTEKGKGRRITPRGQAFLSGVAKEMKK
jgi:small subunit ribosomal protein S19e